MHLILKIADFLDGTAHPESDEDFEDCDADLDGQDDVIDLDKFQLECSKSLVRWLPHIIDRTKTLPHLLNMSRQAENAIDEIQENAFALLTLMLYADPVKQKGVRDAVRAKGM